MSYFNSITQNVKTSSLNSSVANLNSLAIFTGSSDSTLRVAGIQVSLYTTQHCHVWIEQSPDGENWDISDLYAYYAGINNFSITAQAVSSYFRVRVQNQGLIATTSFRLQAVLCPIVEALPRTLTRDGDLQVAIHQITDNYGFGTENTPTDEMRVVIPYRLVGSSFSGSVLDSNYWIGNSGSTSGCVVPLGSQIILTTGSFSGGSSVVQSFRVARYVGGSSNKFRATLRLPDVGMAGNIRKWGAFSTTDGAFFQLSGSMLGVGTRKTSVDTVISSGSFNGNFGYTYPIDTNVRTWEIYWTNSKVFFTVDGDLIHTVFANTDTWSDMMNLPARMETVGSTSGSSADLQVRVATIHRLGSSTSQPTSLHFPLGQTAGTQLKIGSGNVHSVIISGVVNTCNVSLVDSVNAATPVLVTTGAMGAITAPFTLDLMGMPFFNGLRLVVSGANGIVTVIYE